MVDFACARRVWRAVFLFVVAFHLFLLFWMAQWAPPIDREKKMMQRVAVQTIHLNPQKDLPVAFQEPLNPLAASSNYSEPQPAPLPSVEEKSEEVVVKKALVNPKKEAIKETPLPPAKKKGGQGEVKLEKKSPQPVKEEGKQKTIDPEIKKKLLDTVSGLNQSGSNIKSIAKKPLNPVAPLPKELGVLHSDQMTVEEIGRRPEWGQKETDYREKLILYLKQNLKLQEIGAVRIKMTLNRSGKIISHQVMRSDSKKNNDYLVKKLPMLLFPQFGEELFKGVEEYTLVVTLENE